MTRLLKIAFLVSFTLFVLVCCSQKDSRAAEGTDVSRSVMSNQTKLDKYTAKQADEPAETIGSDSDELLLQVQAVPTIHLETQAGNNYDASNLTDGNLSTAWAVDLDKPGVIDADVVDCLSFKLSAWQINRIVIVNGYGKNAEAYYNNTRARSVMISRVPWDEADDSDILFSGEIKDTYRPQSIPVSKTFDNSRPTYTIYVMFENHFYPGQKYNDLCISEIQFWGTPAHN